MPDFHIEIESIQVTVKGATDAGSAAETAADYLDRLHKGRLTSDKNFGPIRVFDWSGHDLLLVCTVHRVMSATYTTTATRGHLWAGGDDNRWTEDPTPLKQEPENL